MDIDSPDDYEPPPDRIPDRAPERAPVDTPRHAGATEQPPHGRRPGPARLLPGAPHRRRLESGSPALPRPLDGARTALARRRPGPPRQISRPQAPSAAKPPCGSRNPPQLCQRLDQLKQTHRSPPLCVVISADTQQQESSISAALCAGARRLRLLSVTGFPVSLRPRLAELAAAGRPRGHAQDLAPVPVASGRP